MVARGSAPPPTPQSQPGPPSIPELPSTLPPPSASLPPGPPTGPGLRAGSAAIGAGVSRDSGGMPAPPPPS